MPNSPDAQPVYKSNSESLVNTAKALYDLGFNIIRLIDVVDYATCVEFNPESGGLGYYAVQLPVSEPNLNGLTHKLTVEAV